MATAGTKPLRNRKPAQRVHLAERFRQALDEDRGTPADAVDL
jgi:hypothetical protein